MYSFIKKFGIFLFIISFYVTPSGSANTFKQKLDDIRNNYEDRIKEIREIDRMENVFSQKITNGLELLKKGDKSGGCRDLFIAIDLHQKIENREMLYAIGNTTTAKAEIAQSEKKAIRKQLLNLAENIYSRECR